MRTKDMHEMPEALPGFATPSAGEIRQHTARAQQMRAEAVAESLVAAYDGLVWLARSAARAAARQYRQLVTRRALNACSDRVLADIGIEREDIPLVARASATEPAGQPDAHWREIAERLAVSSERRRKRHRVYRELMGYSDRELDELGIRRRDIGAIARTA